MSEAINYFPAGEKSFDTFSGEFAAAQVRVTQEKIEQIASDPNLSEEAKRQRISELSLSLGQLLLSSALRGDHVVKRV